MTEHNPSGTGAESPRRDGKFLLAEFEKLAKKMETIRKKANSAPTKKSVDELKKRITKLEKALASKK